MGHWSEELLEKAAVRLGPEIDRAKLKAVLKEAGTEIELLSGQTFGSVERRTLTIDSGGLPFAEVPGLQVGGYSSDGQAWPVPDVVNTHMATVLQLRKPDELAQRAVAIGEALRVAGHLVAAASKSGWLSREYLLRWLAASFDHARRVEFLNRVAEPTARINVPIAATTYGGWWFQITRRLLWVTSSSDEQRLVEPLIGGEGGMQALVGVEPILIAARMTKHPVDWAIAVRIWPGIVRSVDRPWPKVARAIHRHGIPIVAIDKASSPEEMSCQLLLVAYWHQYITREEVGLAEAVAAAYPRAVERLERATNLPNAVAAASLLLEGLLHPGFDPARGAESTRRYVNRKATIAILEHRKVDAVGLRAWESLGVTERFYYKLLKRFSRRMAGRYEVNDRVRDQIRAYLHQRDGRAEKQSAAMELLEERGFTWAAARKWLQRHPLEEAISAWPRSAPGHQSPLAS